MREYDVIINGQPTTVLLDEGDLERYTLAEKPKPANKQAPKPANKAAAPDADK